MVAGAAAAAAVGRAYLLFMGILVWALGLNYDLCVIWCGAGNDSQLNRVLVAATAIGPRQLKAVFCGQKV